MSALHRELCARIAAATDWRALEHIIDDGQAAYAAGTLPAEQLEQQAQAARVRARTIPETTEASRG